METAKEKQFTSLVVRPGPEDDEERTKKKELTEDDIIEILARLPVKSLLRFKCVSKNWYSLIISPNFVSMHYAQSLRNNKVVSLLLYSPKKSVTRRHRNTVAARPPTTTLSFGFGDVTKRFTFSGLMEYVKIVGCFHGVVCLSLSQCPQKYALWNPATRQIREIGGAPMDGPSTTYFPLNGNKNSGWYCSGFRFDPTSNDFEVTQLKFICTEAGEKRAQVNVFSTTTNSWTEKNIVVPYPFSVGGFNYNHRRATFVNGYMHWFIAIHQYGRKDTYTLTIDLEDMYILSYSMVDEVFQRIEMPFSPVYGYCHLSAYEGSLAIFINKRTGSDNSFDEVDVWVLNDCGGPNQAWSKLLTCRPSIKFSFASRFFRKDNVDLVLLSEESDCSLYLCDPENGETKKVGKKDSGTESFIYSESLASLN